MGEPRREIERLAREAGPWNEDAAEAARFLRELSTRATLTDAERKALAILRQREINEVARLRRDQLMGRDRDS